MVEAHPHAIRAISETPAWGRAPSRLGTSWKVSRSPVQISTSIPAWWAWTARVAITSSASYPSFCTTGTRSASSTSWTRLTCPLKSLGVSFRFALYSAYRSVRNDRRATSKATTMWVGRSSRSTLMSIAVNPYTALVGCPVEVEKFSTGSAKKAR
jgi:hypothetical protein